jgi:uncharacterized protein
MQMNVSQLLKEYIGSTRNYNIDEAVSFSDDNDIRVTGGVRLTRTDKGILAQGELQTEIELTCSRCLGQFSCPLTLNIEEEYFPTMDVLTGASLPPPEESGCFTIDGHHIIDLTEAIRQYIMLVMPMKPLCSEGCAGLCPRCGHNLNQGRCNCTPQTDHRWAKLSILTSADKDVTADR